MGQIEIAALTTPRSNHPSRFTLNPPEKMIEIATTSNLRTFARAIAAFDESQKHHIQQFGVEGDLIHPRSGKCFDLLNSEGLVGRVTERTYSVKN